MSLTHPTFLDRPTGATKLVGTVHTSDGVTVHIVFADRAEADETRRAIEKEFGPMSDEGWTLEELAATWECRGEDGCLVVA